jgi:hypothetical protein
VGQNGDVVTCAVDYEGRLKAGNMARQSLKAVWADLGASLRRAHREHRWADLPEICQGCGDWQTAGAEYEPEQVPGTRPFWVRDHRRAAGEVG